MFFLSSGLVPLSGLVVSGLVPLSGFVMSFGAVVSNLVRLRSAGTPPGPYIGGAGGGGLSDPTDNPARSTMLYISLSSQGRPRATDVRARELDRRSGQKSRQRQFAETG